MLNCQTVLSSVLNIDGRPYDIIGKVGEDGTDDDVYIEICSDLNNLVSCCR